MTSPTQLNISENRETEISITAIQLSQAVSTRPTTELIGVAGDVRLINVDALHGLSMLADQSANCVVTSPPYFGLRDYRVAGQIGVEATPEEYVAKLVRVFREVRRVLKNDGTLWLNLGDSYNAHPGQRKTTDKAGVKQRSDSGSVGSPSRCVPGLKPKDLIGIPWRVAFALQADGWYLRSDIIWAKPNPMPESVRDRPTKAHEYMFLLTKSPTYFYDADAIKEPLAATSASRYGYSFGGTKSEELRKHHDDTHLGTRTRVIGNREKPSGRNKRSIWTIPTKGYKGAHFAVFPEALVEPCILAGCPIGGVVLDHFAGSGTTGVVALKHGRNFIGIELNPAYITLAEQRLGLTPPVQALIA